MDDALVALNQKLDLLAAEVALLTAEAELAARKREEREELIRDLTPIGNDLFRLVTEQLEEVQSCADLSNLLRLLKRILRNACNFERMLDQLESLMDLAQTVGPITDSVFQKTTDLLETAEQKGYFDLARSGVRVLDGIAAGLAESSPPAEASLRSLLKQLRDPDVQRGLALVLRILGAIGAQAAQPAFPERAAQAPRPALSATG